MKTVMLLKKKVKIKANHKNNIQCLMMIKCQFKVKNVLDKKKIKRNKKNTRMKKIKKLINRRRKNKNWSKLGNQ